MRSPYPRKTIHFNRDFVNGGSGLFEWFNQMASQTGNASKIMIDALTHYRQLQTHAAATGLTVDEWIERAARLMSAAIHCDAVIATMEGENGQ